MKRILLIWLFVLFLEATCKVQVDKKLNVLDKSSIEEFIHTLNEHFAKGDVETGIEPLDPLNYPHEIFYKNDELGIKITSKNVQFTGLKTLKIRDASWDINNFIINLLCEMDIKATGNTVVESTINDGIDPLVTKFDADRKLLFKFSANKDVAPRGNKVETLMIYNETYSVQKTLHFVPHFPDAKSSAVFPMYIAPLNTRRVRDDLSEKYLNIYISRWINAFRKYLLDVDYNQLISK